MHHSRTEAFVVVLAAVLVLAACSSATDAPEPTPSASESPGISSASPSETAAPSPSVVPPASAEPTPATEPDVGLGPDAVAQVITTDLVVRSLPEISDRSVMDPMRLSMPMLLFILDGPVTADGYDWYPVVPFAWEISDIAHEGPGRGWVAAGSREGEAWIRPIAPDCPDPTVEALQWLTGLARLSCFGTQPLTLEGVLTGCGTGSGAASWLGGSCQLVPFGFEPEGHVPSGMAVRFHPDGAGSPYDGTEMAIRVVGQFDDPGAHECGEFADPPAAGILSCRTEFVVTEISVLERTP
jgi:hypothetical protein